VNAITAPLGTPTTSTAGFRLMSAWNGAADEIRIYDRVISPSEARLAMLLGTVNNAPSLDIPPSLFSVLGLPLSLEAAATDDGLPVNPGQLDVRWTRFSGPGQVDFLPPGVAATGASFVLPGDYVLRLSSSDGAVTTFRDVAVNIKGPPASPTNLRAAEQNTSSIRIAWTDQAQDEVSFAVERRGPAQSEFATIATLPPDSIGYLDANLPAGTSYVYRVRVTNEAGSNYSAEITAATASAGYSAWASAQGANFAGASAAMDADPDRDGMPNLMEYALGGNPLDSTSAPAPAVSLDGSNRLRLTFACAGRSDLVYTVQSSTDLSQWTAIARSQGGAAFTTIAAGSAVIADPGTGARSVTVTDPGSISPRRFLRLQVSSP